MAANKVMCVLYELSEKGAKDLFIEHGIYKPSRDRWMTLFFDPEELTKDERRILLEHCKEGTEDCELVYDEFFIAHTEDIHNFISTIGVLQ